MVAIIGILAAIAIPTFLGQREAAQDRQSHSALRNTITAARAAAAATDNSQYPGANNADLVAELNAAEPSLDFVAGGTASSDPDQISVLRENGNVAAFASEAPNGKCWFVVSALQDDAAFTPGAGTFYAVDEANEASPEDVTVCDAGALTDGTAVGEYDLNAVSAGSFGDAADIDHG